MILIIGIQSNRAYAETYLEVGPAFVSDDYSHGEIVIAGERTEKWDFQMGYITRQYGHACPTNESPHCAYTANEQLMFGVQRIFSVDEIPLLKEFPHADRFEIGVGPWWMQNINRISTSNFNAMLTLAFNTESESWWIPDQVKLRHISNAGSGREWEFCNEFYAERKERTGLDCPTQEFNLGQDGITAVWYF